MHHTLSPCAPGPRPWPARAGLESLEARVLFAADLRSIDGSGNNVLNTDWGATGTALLRLAQAAYADGIFAPAGADRPSARAISNAVAAHPEDEEILSDAHLAAFAYLWGQFIDHDMDLTANASPAEPFNVKVPTGDPQFDPTGAGNKVINLNRSNYADGTGVTSARQQVNDITAFLDGSMIYGSDAARAAALRAFVGGRLKTSAGNLLPLNTAGLPNANDAHLVPDNQLFLAGDVRANENIELTAIQTLFVREHHRLARQIAAQHRDWTDEQIYQQARRLVVAEIQSITYNEFLPALLGPNALPQYTGYKPDVNPGITNEFSTAAFRLGHSMLADDVEFLTDDGEDVRDPLALAQAFFNPAVVKQTGVDAILKYLASSNAEEVDNFVVDGVRNFLFGPPGAGGFDLASLNIQRGRDHGLADYNATRAAVGLARVTSFSQITSNAEVAAKLKALYGSVDNVDLWVGGLAENHVAGGNLGPTFRRIVIDQFARLRDGDRFWYQRDLSASELSMIRGMTLASVISANTGLSNLQANVFRFDVSIAGRVFSDRDGNGRQARGEPGLSGITVSLVDEEGLVAQTTTTNRSGEYRFDGVQIGDYVVRPVLTRGQRFVAQSSATIDVTRGMQFNGVNFALGTVRSAARPTLGRLPLDHLDMLRPQSDGPMGRA